MSEDMPWVIGLTDEEVQELRNNKQQTDMCLMDWEAREWDV